MRRRLSKRRIRLAVVVVTATVVLATPITAFAAMDATLSSSHARPGDLILLLTDDHKATWNYKGLSSEDHQQIYLAPITDNPAKACSNPGSKMVARLQWRGNAGGAAFVVPSLPFADYWLFMDTSGQCWRIASRTGGSREALVLSIGNTPADNQDAAARWTVDSLAPPPEPISQQSRTPASFSPSALTWLGIVGGCALVLVVISVVWWRVRARNRFPG
jgi:hypothetical protein